MLLAVLCAVPMAAQSLTVLPASQLSVPGAPVTLEVHFTPGAQPVSGFSFTLTFQPGTLTFVSAGAGAAATAAGTNVSGSLASAGNVNVTGTGTGVIAEGVVARLTCTALGTGNPFPPVPLSLGSANVTLAAGGSAAPTVTGSVLTYIDRCDVDSSLGIDVVDVQYVVNLILASTQPLFANHGDCNGDQSVDVVDVQLLVNSILNPNQQLAVLTQSVTGPVVGTPYSFAFAAVGGAQPYAWAETGMPIPGLSLSASGTLSGNPTMPGQYSYSVQVTDSNNATASQTFTVNVIQVILQSVVITPSPVVMDHNATVQLTATGTYSDSSTANVTAQMNWTSNAGTVASVGLSTGFVTGVGPGTASVTCTHPTLTSVTASVNVTVNKIFMSLAVTPSNPTIVRLLTQAFTATATFSDSSTENVTSAASWSSTATNVASINSSGIATGNAAGSTTISASRTINGVTKVASTGLTVTQEVLTAITVSPSPSSGFVGGSLSFQAAGTFNNGTNSNNVNSLVTWSSSNPTVATINSGNGLAQLNQAGSATITATRASSPGVTGTSALTVSAIVLTSITVTPAAPSIQVNATQQFTAAGVFSDSSTSPNVNSQVTWSSTNTGVATINSSGLATGLAAGSTTITATRIGGGVSGSATLTVTAPAGVSYSAQIAPLWQQFGCVGCHPGNGGYSMGSYAQVVGNGSSGPAVIPNNAAGSNLYRKIAGTQTSGSRMPVGGPFMNASQLQLVADWINQGALNN